MKKEIKIIRIISLLVLILYICVMIYFLFISERFGRTPTEQYRYNLTPLAEIKRFFDQRNKLGSRYVLLNLLGNIICFVPFGLLVPLVFEKLRSPIAMVFLIAVTTVTVEVVQLYTRLGSCDIDDIILNFLGGMLGYTVFSVCYTLYVHKYGKKKK